MKLMRIYFVDWRHRGDDTRWFEQVRFPKAFTLRTGIIALPIRKGTWK